MGTPLKFTDPVLLQQRIDEYFQHCEDTAVEYSLKAGGVKVRKEQPTMIGLAVWLGCSKDTLYSWMNRERKAGIPEEIANKISDPISYARDRIEKSILNAALDGDVDSRTAGLVLFSHGYTNKTTEDTTVTVKIESTSPVDVSAWSR